MRRPGQRGQSLAEFALVIPVLFLACLAAAQAAMLGLGALLLRRAAQCAARTYAVRFPLEGEAAAATATRAARQALEGRRPRLRNAVLSAVPGGAADTHPYYADAGAYRGAGPSFFRLRLSAELPLFLRLPGFPRSFRLNASSTCSNEATRDFERTPR